MNKNIIARKAQGVFTAITNHYVATLYPEADLTDEELEKRLRFTLQNRTVMWLANETKRSFKDFLDIGKIQDVDFGNVVLLTLSHESCTPENIRDWWHSGGREWSKNHQDAVKHREAEDNIAWVIRDDAKGMFVNLSMKDGVSYVKSPSEALAHDINAPCICEFALKTVYEGLTGSEVRVFTMSRKALKEENISKFGMTKELVHSHRKTEVHEPPVRKQ